MVAVVVVVAAVVEAAAAAAAATVEAVFRPKSVLVDPAGLGEVTVAMLESTRSPILELD